MADVAAYYRVSSKSQGLELQQHDVARAAALRGDQVAVVYEEKRSGKTTDRPELQRLLRDARAGRLPPRLYVFRYDRLSRGSILEMLQLVQTFKDAGVQIVSVRDDFPLSGPAGEYILCGLAFAAQLERVAGEDRRAAAREKREEKGLPFGRPRLVPEGDPREQQILDLDAAGRSVRYIAQAVGVKRNTVHRILQRQAEPSQKSGPETGEAPTREEGPSPPHGA